MYLSNVLLLLRCFEMVGWVTGSLSDLYEISHASSPSGKPTYPGVMSLSLSVLMAIFFQVDLGIPVPECLLDFATAKKNGDGSDNWS